MTSPQQFHTVIIGGGQAGLATGHHLAKTGRSFVILDAHPRIGDAWRTRWDSLKLFTPARRCGLPGMPFPAPKHSFARRDEMADYLERYAEHFALPVRTGVRVDAVGREGERYIVAAGDARYIADNVIVACGAYAEPKTPAFAAELDPRIVQVHSARYRNRGQLQSGPVLVVGPGNSGADIALDVAGAHETTLAGRHPGHIPINITGLSGRIVFPILWLVWTHLLNVSTPVGRRARPKVLEGPEPLIRVKPKHLTAAGVQRVPRVVGVRDGQPLLEDGTVADVENVIWATGYRNDFGWLDLPVEADERGEPVTVRGIVAGLPGLYFVGREFLYAFNSHTIGGVGRDARHIVRHLAARTTAAPVRGSMHSVTSIPT